MNRRKFIIGAMAAVTASYAGGEFLSEGTKFTWHESTDDFGRYSMAVKWFDSAGEEHGMGIRFPMQATKITQKHRDDMKRLLLKWLKEEIK